MKIFWPPKDFWKEGCKSYLFINSYFVCFTLHLLSFTFYSFPLSTSLHPFFFFFNLQCFPLSSYALYIFSQPILSFQCFHHPCFSSGALPQYLSLTLLISCLHSAGKETGDSFTFLFSSSFPLLIKFWVTKILKTLKNSHSWPCCHLKWWRCVIPS